LFSLQLYEYVGHCTGIEMDSFFLLNWTYYPLMEYFSCILIGLIREYVIITFSQTFKLITESWLIFAGLANEHRLLFINKVFLCWWKAAITFLRWISTIHLMRYFFIQLCTQQRDLFVAWAGKKTGDFYLHPAISILLLKEYCTNDYVHRHFFVWDIVMHAWFIIIVISIST